GRLERHAGCRPPPWRPSATPAEWHGAELPRGRGPSPWPTQAFCPLDCPPTTEWQRPPATAGLPQSLAIASSYTLVLSKSSGRRAARKRGGIVSASTIHVKVEKNHFWTCEPARFLYDLAPSSQPRNEKQPSAEPGI